jgi:hypothetical protein
MRRGCVSSPPPHQVEEADAERGPYDEDGRARAEQQDQEVEV